MDASHLTLPFVWTGSSVDQWSHQLCAGICECKVKQREVTGLFPAGASQTSSIVLVHSSPAAKESALSSESGSARENAVVDSRRMMKARR